ncbi:hypothetical protein QFC20_001309 [Naganishia adeliensis]|uniref:Uncharacterized protein n=1 Tax=Naganishia adeliensis TaxID=92952 RepID=A0ACC2WUG0_9TREE|nr:hypothetical protein QFC20_001309 [Naganishia adeliensis]
MSAQTHSNIDAGAQKTHETVDAAANSVHNLANTNPTQRTYQAGHDASVRTQQAGQEASYRAGAAVDDASYRAGAAVDNASYRAGAVVDNASNKAYNAADNVGSAANNAANRTSNAAYNAADKTANVADNAAAKTQDAAYRTRDAASNAANQTRDAAANAANQTRDAAANAANQTRDAAANQTRDAAANAADRTRDAANTVQAKTNEALSNAQETGRRLSTTARQQVSQLADAAAHNPLVQQTQQVSQRQLNALDRELAKYGFLNEFEARTNIPKTYGVLGLGSSAAMLILLNLFGLAQPITNLVGWALPTYLSCRALESPQSGDDKQWLTYWIIFGLLNLLESAALRVILYYIPQYFTFKLAFLVWLLYPGANNAQKVYYSLVRPLFQTGRAKANQVANSAEYGRTNTLNSPGSANYVNSSTGFSSAGTTAADSTGYSTATNPFAGQSSASAGYAQQQQQQTAGDRRPCWSCLRYSGRYQRRLLNSSTGKF